MSDTLSYGLIGSSDPSLYRHRLRLGVRTSADGVLTSDGADARLLVRNRGMAISTSPVGDTLET